MKGDSNVVNSVNNGVASFSSWSKSIANSKTGILRIRGLRRPQPPFKGEHLGWARTSQLAPIYLPQGQAPRFPYSWLK
jgi:hypothetical protein